MKNNCELFHAICSTQDVFTEYIMDYFEKALEGLKINETDKMNIMYDILKIRNKQLKYIKNIFLKFNEGDQVC